MGDINLMDLKNTTHRTTHEKPQTNYNVRKCLKSNLLTLLTVAGVVSGVAVGFILRASKNDPWPARQILYVNFAGDLFLRILKSLILPLIVSSLISAIGSLDLSLSGKIGVRAICYYLATTLSAVILGIIMVVIIHPGKGDSSSIARAGISRNVTTVDTLMDLFRLKFNYLSYAACLHPHPAEIMIRPYVLPPIIKMSFYKLFGIGRFHITFERYKYTDGTFV